MADHIMDEVEQNARIEQMMADIDRLRAERIKLNEETEKMAAEAAHLRTRDRWYVYALISGSTAALMLLGARLFG